MCEAKPGPRCAADTRGDQAGTAAAYAAAHPAGPTVGPLESAQAALTTPTPPAAASPSTRPFPKAAQAIIDDATAAGYKVTVDTGMWDTDSPMMSVFVDAGNGTTGNIQYAEKNTAGVNSRLGFHTDFKGGMRFDYADVHLAYDTWQNGKPTRYPKVTSARQFRGYLGLPS